MQGILLKYGEIALRGKNRYIFENRLIDIINSKIPKEYKTKKEQGRILIESPNKMDYNFIIPILKNIIGITYICPCYIIDTNNIDNIKEEATKYLKENYTQNYTFKVKSKRANKNYPLNSIEISKEVGGYILDNIENATVDVINPEVILNIELRSKTYIFSKIIKGIGGLPITGGGKALLMLSGGIDSPVAGFLTARRGVEIDAIYFHASPYTSEHAKQKVIDLAKIIKGFTSKMNLHIVNFTKLQLFLYENVPNNQLTIFLKREMLRISEQIAKNINAQAIVMGDSIGQVASQTIYSMAVIDEAANGISIIRPLATYDKQEIIDIAVKIDTYPLSILPYEDCCTIFVAKHPTTRPHLTLIRRFENKFSDKLNELRQNTIENDTHVMVI
ncbi:MAG: tRNA 4-thiouridine(8) synthase ThiI [Defluviitaleaceae bacterium]|nr:tRNA 4-thiouridine(8) synthase ThiI [Defluviitaleaceae bacterium]